MENVLGYIEKYFSNMSQGTDFRIVLYHFLLQKSMWILQEGLAFKGEDPLATLGSGLGSG